MWKVPVSIPEFGHVNYPNVCPVSPKRGHAFCKQHCEKASMLGYPAKLKEFYKHCGVSNTDVNTGLILESITVTEQQKLEKQPLTLS